MTMPCLSRRFVALLKVPLSILVGLAAATSAGAAGGAGAGGAPRASFGPAAAQRGLFPLFESGQVRPLALSPSGNFLFAANPPDDRLEVFRIVGHGLEHRASITVGLEPVAVAARNDNEI